MTVTQKRSSVTLSDLATWRRLVAHTNQAKWWGFNAGEVLYLGGTGQGTQRGEWAVTHKFAVGENQTNVSPCDGLTFAFVGAWHYMWFTYTTDASGVTQILDGYVERVYIEADFGLIGLGV
jgi:hypothetical protein